MWKSFLHDLGIEYAPFEPGPFYLGCLIEVLLWGCFIPWILLKWPLLLWSSLLRRNHWD